jgi:hypothetical protein
MKPTLTLLACALLAMGVLACGGSGNGAGQASGGSASTVAHVELPKIETKDDPDDDSDNYPKQLPDRDEVPYYKTEPFGHPADRADARGAAILVMRYYADAARGDAAAACRLLYAPREEAMTGEDRARSLHLSQPAAACAVLLSQLFAEERAMLRAQDATLKIGAVRTEYNTASVQMYFGRPPVVHYIEAHRERGVWKLDTLLAEDHPVGVE